MALFGLDLSHQFLHSVVKLESRFANGPSRHDTSVNGDTRPSGGGLGQS